ncbi:dihydrofolate reductase family protein [Cellulomonas sp. URHD0024]|uniref:dihydrofolate reductase family protein n=1 Tax=Cellulomonas sp. URHD0024 TaxID=1302620 RepID=UPI0004837EA2|nr:dihydrofolate reductase family protein [Cellulomonas sp. URHD0024]
MAVILDITISLDGFVTAPNAGPENGLGDDGLGLHAWAIGDRTPEDLQILAGAADVTGAVVMGRNTFDVVDGPRGWNDERHYGADQGDPAAPPPCFVVTHEAPEHVRLTDRMTIVTTGLRDALDQAAEAAGGKHVVIMGGGSVGGQALRERLVDRLNLHVAPLVLGAGTPLFDGGPRVELRLDEDATVVTRNAAHLFYEVIR